MIYYGVIESGGDDKLFVCVTAYARLLGLENYHPPAGFPQIDETFGSIGYDESDRYLKILDMDETNQRAIFREPKFMYDYAAYQCKYPALRVAFYRPLLVPELDSSPYPQVVFTTSRLRRFLPSSEYALGLYCSYEADKLGLHIGDLIGVEIIDYAWEGWKDVTKVYPGYDGKPLWMWTSALTIKDDSCDSNYSNYCNISYFVDEFNALLQDGQFYSGQGFPLPYTFNNASDQYRRQMEEVRVLYSKKNYDPDDPDLNAIQRLEKWMMKGIEKRKKRTKND